MRIWECPPRYCTHRRMASGARPSRPAGLAVEAHQAYATRNVHAKLTRFSGATFHPHISAHLPFCLM